jgi:hypothetical protein
MALSNLLAVSEQELTGCPTKQALSCCASKFPDFIEEMEAHLQEKYGSVRGQPIYRVGLRVQVTSCYSSTCPGLHITHHTC